MSKSSFGTQFGKASGGLREPVNVTGPCGDRLGQLRGQFFGHVSGHHSRPLCGVSLSAIVPGMFLGTRLGEHGLGQRHGLHTRALRLGMVLVTPSGMSLGNVTGNLSGTFLGHPFEHAFGHTLEPAFVTGFPRALSSSLGVALKTFPACSPKAAFWGRWGSGMSWRWWWAVKAFAVRCHAGREAERGQASAVRATPRRPLLSCTAEGRTQPRPYGYYDFAATAKHGQKPAQPSQTSGIQAADRNNIIFALAGIGQSCLNPLRAIGLALAKNRTFTLAGCSRLPIPPAADEPGS